MNVSINFVNSTKKALRTVLQLALSGGLTALVTNLAGHLNPADEALVLSTFQVGVTFLQNYLEGKGIVPVLLAPTVPKPKPASRARKK